LNQIRNIRLAMNISKDITSIINQAVRNLSLEEKNFSLDHPASEEHGEFSTNIALVATKKAGQNPRELAETIKNELDKLLSIKAYKELYSYLDRVEIAGPGFINFYLSDSYFIDKLQTINTQKDQYGQNDSLKNKKIIVEYSSPNIAKPFTIGHLRSTVIGDAVANIMEANGATVLRDNHLGDWGTQFGKQIYALMHLGGGSLAKNIKKIKDSANPVKELVTLYIKFHEEAEKDKSLDDKARVWFKKLEDGDKEARRLWQLCVDWSWVEFEKIYQKLGIDGFYPEFNGGRGLGESFFEDKMADVIKILEDEKLLKEGKGGAKLVFFKKDKFPPAMILKGDGATLYHTRDLATDKYRLDKYQPDLIINEVGSEQTLYFQQLYEMEKMLGWYKEDQRVHIGHGMIRFKDQKMSTRKGNVVWLQEVLDEAVTRALKLQSERDQKSAEAVGIGALKYNDLKGSPQRDMVFDWDEILNMKGNSGPYLQYTYARSFSVLAKANDQLEQGFSLQGKENPFPMEVGIDLNPEEKAVLAYLYRFSEVVLEAGTTYSPHLICTYLYELASRFNTFYNKHSILGTKEVRPLEVRIGRTSNPDTTQFRLTLTSATAQVIQNGLKLLGINAPDKM